MKNNIFKAVTYAEASFHFYEGYYPMHTHAHWEFFIVTNGEFTHIINNRTEILHKNDFVFLKPDDFHELTPKKNTKAQHLNVFLTDDLFKDITTIFSEQLFEAYKNNLQELALTLKNSEYNSFIKIIEKYNSLNIPFMSDNDLHSLTAKLLFFEAIKLTANKVLALNNSFPKWLNDFIFKISQPENFLKNIDELTKSSGYCRDHLLRQFKKYTNKTLIEYFVDLKINYACNLLKHTSFSTLNISSSIGYDSLSYFNKIFKQKLGTTPSKYRRGGE